MLQIRQFGKRFDFIFQTIILGGADKKASRMPLGSAYVTMIAAPLPKEEEEVKDGDGDEESCDNADNQIAVTDHDDAVVATKTMPDARKLLNELAARCVSTLNGEQLGGRMLRVQRSSASEARRKLGRGSLGGGGSGESSRYFVMDISTKCMLCEQVGHKQFECTEEPIPTPCHLCAGRDHEASKCYTHRHRMPVFAAARQCNANILLNSCSSDLSVHNND